MKTAILGGGLSGLTLARLLHEKGEDIVVLEAESEVGGLCRSKTSQGFTFDTGGSHIIFSRDSEVLEFMRRMIAGNEQRNNRNTKIFYKGKYVKYPFENGLSDLPPEDRFACVNGFVKMMIAVEKGEKTAPSNFREWIYYTFGTGIAECYMIPYNEKIWKFPTDLMSCHWVEGRIPRPPVEDIIKSAIGISTEGYTHQAIFSYPLDGGIEALVHSIAKPIEKFIRTGFRVNAITKTGSRWMISNGDEVIQADRCICSMPIQHLLPCIRSVPATVRNAADALKYNSLLCVTIGIKGPVPDISWLYIPEHSVGRTNRISFPSGYSCHVAPDGCSAIVAEITHQPGDEVATLPDYEILREVLEMLQEMQILNKDQVVFSSVERKPFAYVVYDCEYLKNIAIIRKFCSETEIALVGRFAQFEYLNMDGCIRSVMDYVAAS